jgi:membrane-associated phospholipid phosphatase
VLTRLVNQMTGFLGRAFGRASAGPSEEVPPDTTEGTVEPLREGVREALVPRWLAVLRTRVFTLVAASALAVFAVLAALVEAGMTAEPDLAGSLAVQHLATPWVAALMGGVSALGFPPLSVYLVIGVVALFWLAGYRTESAFAIVASASAILTQAIKTIVERPRPAPDLVRVIQDAPGYSFPSGHTLFYTTFFGFIGYAAYALLKPGHLRTAVLWVCGALIVLVGPSRIWLGHHWPSDVLASYALGLAYLIFLVQLYSRVRLRSRVAASPDRPV